jgi:signal transduction histidine kinase
MWSYLFIGFGIGVLLAIPLAGVWGRRTERRVRQLEQRTRAAERLAELGTLTGGLAHEIKNPLSTVGLNVQLLQEDVHDLSQNAGLSEAHHDGLGRVQRRLESLSRETHRLRDILEDFLRFAGRVELDPQPTDLHAMIEELIDFFEPQAREAGINLRSQLAAKDATVSADAALLKQAMLNLLINAVQAMTQAREKGEPHGGADELMVRTELGRSPGGDEFRIHVTDTGPGMNQDVAAKVFQPYFSTKRGGTGLGLPTSRRIIEEHGGHLSVHADPGRGTDFTLSLPA